MNIKHYLSQKRQLVEDALADLFPEPPGVNPDHDRYFEAMGYSLFAGGKRLRPILSLAACEAVGGTEKNALTAACALEWIHTYSLIHDDLPAMDNDDLRRGKPTNHVVYGEAQAILAGDGLLTGAFELLTEQPETISSRNILAIIRTIARGAGAMGMAGGQAIDIASEGQEIDIDTLRQIHQRKTGALITAAVQVGCLAGNGTPRQFEALTTYGEQIGLAFQIVDDLLNVEGTPETLGKASGSDAERQKATYPGIFGIEESRKQALAAVETALESLAAFADQARPLREIAEYIRVRNR